MSLIRQSLVSALAAAVNSGGRFGVMVLLARRLSSTEFGQFVYAQWLVDLAFLACALGVNGSASRYLAEYAHDPPRRALFLRRWLPWALTLPFLSGLVAVFGALLSGMRFTPMDYFALGTWTVTTGWWVMQTGALFGQQRFDLVLTANVTALTVAIPTAAFVPTAGDSTALLLFGMTLSSLVAATFGVRQQLTSLRGQSDVQSPDLPWRRIQSYAANVWVTGVLGGLVWSRGELLVVRARLGDEGVAQYTVALTLLFGAMQIIMLSVSGVAPHLTSEWGRGERAKTLSLARRLADVQLLLSTSAAVLLTCLAPELLTLAFGPSYRSSTAPLVILALGLVTLSASAQNHLLQMDTDARFNRTLSIAGVVILFSLAAVTTSPLGIVGAALARLLTMWALFVVTLIVASRSLGAVTFSGRNLGVAVGVVSVLALAMAAGEEHYAYRAASAVAGVAILVLALRGGDGGLVATSLVRVGWSRVRG